MEAFGMMKAAFAAALLLALGMAGGAPARANTCQTEHVTCPTTMPVDGYCECHVRGATEGGTVVAKAQPRQAMKAQSGGCGAEPDAPGCR